MILMPSPVMLNTPTIKEAQMMIAAILATCAAASSLADQIRAAQRRSRRPVDRCESKTCRRARRGGVGCGYRK